MTDLAAPYRTDGSGRTATTDSAARHARDLIEAVLLTIPGERVNRPDFGSGIAELLFEPGNEALETAADFLVRSAIQRHLSDVLTVTDLGIVRHEGALEIRISYVLAETGGRDRLTIRRDTPGSAAGGIST